MPNEGWDTDPDLYGPTDIHEEYGCGENEHHCPEEES